MSDGGLVGLVDYPSENEAREAARQLLENGIGCDIAPEADGQAQVVQVLPIDVKRAKKHLGIPADAPSVPTRPTEGSTLSPNRQVGPTGGSSKPARTSAGTGADKYDADGHKVHQLIGGRIEATTRQIVVAALIYLAALIIIPLLAFYATTWAVDSGSDEHVPVTLPE